jgi:hypothetical protein
MQSVSSQYKSNAILGGAWQDTIKQVTSIFESIMTTTGQPLPSLLDPADAQMQIIG